MIDTYDTEKAAKKACKYGNNIRGVRIDSGDLIQHSKKVREILDDNGCRAVIIVASSDLNEYKIKKMIDSNAPIDAFGVGTELATSRDDPTISGVYKLIEYNGKPKIKISEEKITYPGKKQIYRIYNEQGFLKEDILMLDDDEAPTNSEALLVPIMEKGKLINKLPNIMEIQQYYIKNIKKLPKEFKTLDENHVFMLKISEKLNNLINLLNKNISSV